MAESIISLLSLFWLVVRDYFRFRCMVLSFRLVRFFKKTLIYEGVGKCSEKWKEGSFYMIWGCWIDSRRMTSSKIWCLVTNLDNPIWPPSFMLETQFAGKMGRNSHLNSWNAPFTAHCMLFFVIWKQIYPWKALFLYIVTSSVCEKMKFLRPSHNIIMLHVVEIVSMCWIQILPDPWD